MHKICMNPLISYNDYYFETSRVSYSNFLVKIWSLSRAKRHGFYGAGLGFPAWRAGRSAPWGRTVRVCAGTAEFTGDA
jgi:hypothetical protein